MPAPRVKSPKIYKPTMEEFRDFSKFVERIEREDEAHKIGICKIIPPEEWVPRKKGYALKDIDLFIEGPIKQKFQLYDGEYPGCYQAKSSTLGKIHVKDYYKKANSEAYKPPRWETYDDLERKYWKSIEFRDPPIYGCDVARSFTDPDLDVWNLSKLNTILNIVNNDLDTVIQGMNSPYLYFGMWRATFSWHVEDMDLYGINMVHYGAPKSWYCVPPKYGHLLEKLAKKVYSETSTLCTNFMRHKTCIISPKVLEKHNIPYNKLVQKAREIIIVFPYAYHSGFNHGFNIAEAINFASPRWIEYGKRHRPCDCDKSRVKFTMDPFIQKFQPELYEKWMRNLDIAPHPEDPPEIIEKVLIRAKDPLQYAKNLEKQTADRLANGTWDPMKPTDIVLDVYKHVEFQHLEISIEPKTFRIFEGRKDLEAWFQRDNIDIKQLIEDGILFKADEAVLPGDAASKLEEAAEISVGFQRLNPKKSKENDEDNDPDWDPKPVEKIISPKKTYENQISGSTNNGARKRPNIKLEEPDPKNIAVYKHSTDNWQIKINEDSWTLFENQIIPKEAKEFLELPLQDLIELGILIRITVTKKSEIDEKKSKIVKESQVKIESSQAKKEEEDDDFEWPMT